VEEGLYVWVGQVTNQSMMAWDGQGEPPTPTEVAERIKAEAEAATRGR